MVEKETTLEDILELIEGLNEMGETLNSVKGEEWLESIIDYRKCTDKFLLLETLYQFYTRNEADDILTAIRQAKEARKKEEIEIQKCIEQTQKTDKRYLLNEALYNRTDFPDDGHIDLFVNQLYGKDAICTKAYDNGFQSLTNNEQEQLLKKLEAFLRDYLSCS